MSIVNVQNLSKSYGDVEALKSIRFKVSEGELFGFIGPDGAGKTTLFRILTTLLKPDEGSVTVMGDDVMASYRTLRTKLGYMPGRFSLYQDLSVRENMDFFASVFGTTLDANYDLVKPIYSQLEKFEDRPAGALSGGMKQKLALSCALIHKPELLILDEPTTGVDAVSRQEFWQMLQHLKSQHITIIASTPYMDEAEQCDRVALIDKGMILKIDTPQNIVRDFDKPLLAVKADNTYRLINTLREYEHADSVQPFGEYLHYFDKRGKPDAGALRRYLEDAGFNEIDIKPAKPDIEDSFMDLMQQEEAHEV